MSDERARAAAPIAAALTAAVAARDAEIIEEILNNCGDFHALAVVLAANAAVPPRLPIGVAPVFTPQRRRELHAAFKAGKRDALTCLGEREYHREAKRRRHASPNVLDDASGRWVNSRAGVQVWVSDNERRAG